MKKENKIKYAKLPFFVLCFTFHIIVSLLIVLFIIYIFRAVYSLHVDHPLVLDQILEDQYACLLSLMAYLVTNPHMVSLGFSDLQDQYPLFITH